MTSLASGTFPFRILSVPSFIVICAPGQPCCISNLNTDYLLAAVGQTVNFSADVLDDCGNWSTDGSKYKVFDVACEIQGEN